jgi:hypothetical protein
MHFIGNRAIQLDDDNGQKSAAAPALQPPRSSFQSSFSFAAFYLLAVTSSKAGGCFLAFNRSKKSAESPVLVNRRPPTAFISRNLLCLWPNIVVPADVLANVPNAPPVTDYSRYLPRRFISFPSAAPITPLGPFIPSFLGITPASLRLRRTPIWYLKSRDAYEYWLVLTRCL